MELSRNASNSEIGCLQLRCYEYQYNEPTEIAKDRRLVLE